MNGQYYGMPAWNQTLPAHTRFVVLTNMASEAVLDKETGLVWEKTPSASTFNWFDAQTYCYNVTIGGRKGWRLPMVQELTSLVDTTQSNPALPAGHPFSNLMSGYYWSATSTAYNTDLAWAVNLLFFGDVHEFEKRIIPGNIDPTMLYVWCVRGGSG